MTLLSIASSWFASPVFSGLVSVSIFWLIRKFIIRSTEPLEKGLKMLPLAYSITIAVNVLSIAMDGPKRKFYFDSLVHQISLPIHYPIICISSQFGQRTVVGQFDRVAVGGSCFGHDCLQGARAMAQEENSIVASNLERLSWHSGSRGRHRRCRQ